MTAEKETPVRCDGPYGPHRASEGVRDTEPCGWQGRRSELRGGCCPVCGAGYVVTVVVN